MPIYEYHCGACDDKVAVLVRSSTAQPLCPDCGNLLTDKVFSVPNVHTGRASRPAGHTCCGQQDRCDSPPCSDGGPCCQDR